MPDTNLEKFTGTIRIVAAINGPEEGNVNLTLTEDKSRIVFFDADFTFAEWGRIIASPSDIPVTFTARWERFGWKSENKEIFVPLPKGKRVYDDPTLAATCLKPFEVDGWTPRSGDFGNHHRLTKQAGQDGYHVVFFRHVAP